MLVRVQRPGLMNGSRSTHTPLHPPIPDLNSGNVSCALEVETIIRTTIEMGLHWTYVVA
jgi:hypothetical protein